MRIVLILAAAGLAGCTNFAGGDGETWGSRTDQWGDVKAAYKLRTPKGAEFGADVERKIDSEAIRATGDSAAKVITSLGEAARVYGLKLVPANPTPAGPAELPAILRGPPE